GILMLAVAVVGLVSCNATPAVESMHNQVSLAASTQPTAVGQNEIASRRLLRTAETSEERGYESLKSLLPGMRMWPKDGKTLPTRFVKKMLRKELLRTKVFEDWTRADIDGPALREALGDMTKKGRAELLTRFTAFLGPQPGLVYHRRPFV
ncbi:hypothetical protein L917_14833, partial [Phytophthora nicotianae]